MYALRQAMRCIAQHRAYSYQYRTAFFDNFILHIGFTFFITIYITLFSYFQFISHPLKKSKISIDCKLPFYKYQGRYLIIIHPYSNPVIRYIYSLYSTTSPCKKYKKIKISLPSISSIQSHLLKEQCTLQDKRIIFISIIRFQKHD